MSHFQAMASVGDQGLIWHSDSGNLRAPFCPLEWPQGQPAVLVNSEDKLLALPDGPEG